MSKLINKEPKVKTVIDVTDAIDVSGATVNDSAGRELPPSTAPAQGGFMQIIDKVALTDNIDVDKLERMMLMQERWEAKQAEKAFNEALSRIAEKMPRIIKGNAVAYKEKEAFKYATYETIDKAVRPLLVEEGMSLSYNTETRPGGGAVVTGTLSHRNGHFRTASIPVPLDSSGGKNDVQGMGSTFSYGKRYTMCMLLNIVTVGEDDDAQGGPVTDEQAAQIKSGLRETGLDTDKFLKAMKAESVEEIRTKDLTRALATIENKRYMNKKAAEKQEKK